jgi:L-2-hydroxyglutarate oxidase LhgO
MMERFDIECVVIGAGVVGLAVARELALNGREVMVLEKEAQIGTETSSRNSEVIHAGIYYPQGSLKARFCVEGKSKLYAYCEQNNIPFKRCGKVIVATNKEQVSSLEKIQKQAKLNGVTDLSRLSQNELYLKEPDIAGLSALFSPSTGVLDCHAYMLQLYADLESAGGQCVFNSEIQIAKQTSRGLELVLNGDEALVRAKCCVNAAGLGSFPLLQSYYQSNDLALPLEYRRAYFAKGSYFSYSGVVPFEHLIYPVPEPGGLGIHLTLDMQGRAKFGPDVEWLDIANPRNIDYRVDSNKKQKFYEAVSQYWPKLEFERMQADYSGVRPKLSSPKEKSVDFSIQGPQDHGIKGLVNLLGIESPGLTSSLAIAEYVANILDQGV